MRPKLILAALIATLSLPAYGKAPKSSHEASVKVVEGREITVTITVYWAHGGGGSDRDTRKFRSSSGPRLREGVSVAVDPDVIPYGSVISIDGIGIRVAVDTGTDVVSRTASKNRGTGHPVVDVFFEDRDDALAFARRFERSHGNVTTVKLCEA